MGNAYCPYCGESYCGRWHDRDNPSIVYPNDKVYVPIPPLYPLPDNHRYMAYHRGDHDLCWKLDGFSTMNLIPRPYEKWICLEEAFPCVPHFYPDKIPCDGQLLERSALRVSLQAVNSYYTYNNRVEPPSWCQACKARLPDTWCSTCPHCNVELKGIHYKTMLYPTCVCTQKHVSSM